MKGLVIYRKEDGLVDNWACILEEDSKFNITFKVRQVRHVWRDKFNRIPDTCKVKVRRGV